MFILLHYLYVTLYATAIRLYNIDSVAQTQIVSTLIVFNNININYVYVACADGFSSTETSP